MVNELVTKAVVDMPFPIQAPGSVSCMLASEKGCDYNLHAVAERETPTPGKTFQVSDDQASCTRDFRGSSSRCGGDEYVLLTSEAFNLVSIINDLYSQIWIDITYHLLKFLQGYFLLDHIFYNFCINLLTF